jgi:hypothetical protein
MCPAGAPTGPVGSQTGDSRFESISLGFSVIDRFTRSIVRTRATIDSEFESFGPTYRTGPTGPVRSQTGDSGFEPPGAAPTGPVGSRTGDSGFVSIRSLVSVADHCGRRIVRGERAIDPAFESAPRSGAQR